MKRVKPAALLDSAISRRCQATLQFRYLAEGPGELHVLAGGVAALQQPRPAVDVHQTLVVVVVDGGAQDSEVELLGAGVVDILQTDGRRRRDGELVLRKTKAERRSASYSKSKSNNLQT